MSSVAYCVLALVCRGCKAAVESRLCSEMGVVTVGQVCDIVDMRGVLNRRVHLLLSVVLLVVVDRYVSTSFACGVLITIWRVVDAVEASN